MKSDSDIESIEDLKGEEVCSASGSTSLENVTAAGAVGVPADTYSICAEQVADGSVPAMSTDGSILLGLAAQYDGELKVVGPEFSEERIGIGYSKDAPGDVRVDQRRHPGGVRRRHLGRGVRGDPRRDRAPRRPSRRRSTPAS